MESAVFDIDIDTPNIVLQTPIAVAPFGNAASVGQLNFADESTGLAFDNSLALGQLDWLF